VLDDSLGGEDVVEIAFSVVFLRGGGIGNPIAVDNKL